MLISFILFSPSITTSPTSILWICLLWRPLKKIGMSLWSFLSPTCSSYSYESIFLSFTFYSTVFAIFNTLSLYQTVLSFLWVIKSTGEMHFILKALFSCDEINQCRIYLICREFIYCNHRNGPFIHVFDVFTCMKNLYA